jgi:hypothetical protein
MALLIVAALCAGLFAGAAVYITAVEHPARMSCGTELAVREFAPSYHRASIMQASLAIAGSLSGFSAVWMLEDGWSLVASALLAAVVPFTLIVIRPTNQQLLDPGLDPRSERAAVLLTRWGRLHAVRSALSSVAFVVFLVRLCHL